MTDGCQQIWRKKDACISNFQSLSPCDISTHVGKKTNYSLVIMSPNPFNTWAAQQKPTCGLPVCQMHQAWNFSWKLSTKSKTLLTITSTISLPKQLEESKTKKNKSLNSACPQDNVLSYLSTSSDSCVMSGKTIIYPKSPQVISHKTSEKIHE